jgi:L-rhamnose isomerase/sugar isomerase
MIDQSHNLKDPIEALLQTVDQLQRAHAKSLLVDRAALTAHQEANDVLLAESVLQAAFSTDVGPLVAEARRRQAGAIDPLAVFRASGYRGQKREERAAAAYAPPQSL